MGIYDNPDVADNNNGSVFYHAGMKEKGLILLRKAASKGQPNAIASLIWYDLLADKYDSAIKTYEELSKLVPAWINTESERINRGWFVNKEEVSFVIWGYNYQLSNIRSNAAVAYMATGKKEVALKLWATAASDHGHLEARFYPILIAMKDDLESMRTALISNFSKEQLLQLVSDMNEVSAASKGWFGTWAKQGIGSLKAAANQTRHGETNLGQVAAGTAVGLTGFEIAARNAAKNYFQDQAAESVDGEGAFDWLGDLFG